MANQRAAFFFGSGISKLSGAPMVDRITEDLLQKAWKPHTDWRFYPCRSEDGTESIGVAKLAQLLLQIIRESIEPHLLVREGRRCHYEDLYSAALQIVQDETAQVTNPLVAKSSEFIKSATSHLWLEMQNHIDKNQFASLADRAVDLIQWAVFYGIIEARKPAGLTLMGQVAKSTSELDVFSLNHDRLVEMALSDAGVAFADGFATKRGDVRIFDWSWDTPHVGVRILKLHGSINWYLFRFKEWDQFAAVESDPYHCRDSDGSMLDLLGIKPMFLTGTTVKEQSYGTGLFGEIFTQFRRLLSKHRTLICCGYGWSDSGINIRLFQWLRDHKDNKLVILHNDPNEDVSQKRFWFWNWEGYSKAGKVVVLPKWLSECTLADLEPYFEA